MKRINMLLWAVLFCGTTLAWGQSEQDPSEKEGTMSYETSKPFRLLEIDDPEDGSIGAKQKKRRKPRVFYGLKTRKKITRKGYRPRETTELFFCLKKPDLPDHFVRDIFWYDFARQEVRKTKKFDPEKGVLLHGSYQKRQGKQLLEEGIFYKGTKHGRWMYYDTRGTLTDKQKYYKGWPKESLIRYHDPIEKTNVKEVIPMEHKEREGYYYQFHENGVTAVQGEYKWDHKVGEWIENYPSGRRKKIISYPEDPFEKDREPFVKSEWDSKGKKRYSNRGRQ